MGYKIALAGNPNCGKTTTFNHLTGSSQYVGNWPGVTVEKKEDRFRDNKDITITDLPGIYSLSPYTLEEVVTRDYLLQETPDAIVNLVDGTNLERNLYLTTQLAELGIPMVIAVNMMDIVRKNGDKFDIDKLKQAFGCEVVETSALKGTGCVEAVNAAISLIKSGTKTRADHIYSKDVEEIIGSLGHFAESLANGDNNRWFAVKIFERDEKVMASLDLAESQKAELDGIISVMEDTMDDDAESIITNERYDYITAVANKAIKKGNKGQSTSDKIDRIVTNRWLALPIFAAIMFIVYYVSVTTIGAVVTDWTNDTLFGEWIGPGVQGWLEGMEAAPWLIGLVVDGIIGGVGSVLGFVPQMMILFIFLSILEDCGYMARVAFIMDRIFRRFGLSGKSFIPMLIASGCGVPGLMASKTIENVKDRRMTLITTTFIPCGAKLPVIALIAGAIMGGAWWMAPAMYFMGVVAVILSGVILKKTRAFAGDPAPFVMELPQYHRPAAKSVLIHMWERSKAFIIKAGTVIFVACGLIWFLSNFGWENGDWGMVDVENSVLASIGSSFVWIFAPLGFGNWKATIATISGLVAKENVVGTFGVLFGMAEAAEDTSGLWESISELFPTTAAAAAFLVFNLLCAPCFAAIGVISREMASKKWTAIALGYQTCFAYLIAMMVYQFGNLYLGHGFDAGSAVAIAVLGLLLFLIFRPAKKSDEIEAEREAA